MTQPNDLETRVRALEAQVDALHGQLHNLRAQMRSDGVAIAPVPPPRRLVAPEQNALAPRPDLEAQIGTSWLGRAGIVALTTGIAFLILYRFGELGPVARITLGYLLGLGLVGLGAWLAAKHELLGRVVLGGGLAVTYFMTYALHFVPAVRVIESQALAFALLTAVVLGIIAIAQRLKSETVAGFAMFLGLHAGILSPVGSFTLLSASLLAAGGTYFLVRNRWILVPTSTLVAVYSTHATYALHHGGTLGQAFVALYFAVFSIALLVHRAGLSRTFTAGFALLNWLGALLIAGIQWEPLALDVPVLTGLAVTLAVISALSWRLGTFAQVAPVYLPAALATAALALVQQPNALRTEALLGVTAALLGRWLGHGALQLSSLGLLAGVLVATFALPPLDVPVLVGLAVAFLALGRLHALLWRLDPAPLETLVDAQGSKPLLDTLYPMASGAGLLAVAPQFVPGRTWAFLLAALLLSGLGFAWRDRGLRWMGLTALLLSVGHFLVRDLARASTDYRIGALLLLGVALLGVSYAYSRLRERLGRWL